MVSPGCSVVTITHNHAEIIDEFIESASDLPDVDVFVVDDHSSDTTADIVSHYADRRDNIRFLEYRGPKSAARALNFGLSETDSKIVVVVQPTVRLTADLIQQLLNALEKNPHIHGVIPELSRKQAMFRSYSKFPDYWDGLIAGFIFPENWFTRLRTDTDPGIQNHFTDISWCNSPVLCLRTETVEQVGYFDESFPENLYQLDWLFRLRKNSGEIAQVPGVYVNFFSSVRDPFDLRSMITSHVGLFKYFEKHYDRVHHQVFNLIVGGVLYLLLPVKLFIRLVKMKK